MKLITKVVKLIIWYAELIIFPILIIALLFTPPVGWIVLVVAWRANKRYKEENGTGILEEHWAGLRQDIKSIVGKG